MNVQWDVYANAEGDVLVKMLYNERETSFKAAGQSLRVGTRGKARCQRFGMGHVALEVSYSVYPAVLETIGLRAEVVKPALDHG